MTGIAILTPSYLPDLNRFKRLHQSILRFTDEGTLHHVIVPRRDLEAFRGIGSTRLRVWSEADFIPRGFVPTDALAAFRRRIPVLPASFNCSAINLLHPWPPLRGWILQQILKLSAATQLGCHAVIVIDSDVVLVKPLTEETFIRKHVVRTYEKPGAVSAELGRHLGWTQAAYALLGIPWTEQADFPDYVGGIVSWDPQIVAGCLSRIEAVSGRDWASAVAGYLHFSEFILYGTYLRHFGTTIQRSFCEPSTLCHSYWSTVPLTDLGATAFVEAYSESDVAVHVQSNSGTSQELINRILLGLERRTAL